MRRKPTQTRATSLWSKLKKPPEEVFLLSSVSSETVSYARDATVGGAHLPLHCSTQRHWQDKVQIKWQPKKCCTGMKALGEYKWETLQGSVTEKIICHCQACIVSGGVGSFKGGDDSGYRAVVNNFLVHGEENDFVQNIKPNKGNNNGLQKKAPTSVPFTESQSSWGLKWRGLTTTSLLAFHVTSNLSWTVNPTATAKTAVHLCEPRETWWRASSQQVSLSGMAIPPRQKGRLSTKWWKQQRKQVMCWCFRC